MKVDFELVICDFVPVLLYLRPSFVVDFVHSDVLHDNIFDEGRKRERFGSGSWVIPDPFGERIADLHDQ